MGKPKVTDETRRQLSEMFLPELHQAWWAERLAQLIDEQQVATDPVQVKAIEDQIREHYKSEYDVELTRRRLGDLNPHDA